MPRNAMMWGVTAAAVAALGLVEIPGAQAANCTGSRCFNIEIDYMVDNDHTHKPNQAEIDAIVQMFACQGYTLNVEISDAIPHHDVMVRDPLCLVFFDYNLEESSFGRLKGLYFDHGGQPGWHYCIFGHQYEGTTCQPASSSGMAEQPGDDFVVTLSGSPSQAGTAFERAATFAHEFGHNLGLSHCGANDPGFFLSCNNVGASVLNLASIMTYSYQLTGVRSAMLCNGLSFDEAALFKEIDYSHGTMCTLNEAALDEKFGMGMTSVDWNCSGVIDNVPVAKDLSGGWLGRCDLNGALHILNDYDEWGAIQDLTYSNTAAELTNMPTSSCISPTETEMLNTARSCPPPTLTTEACIDRRMVYLKPGGSAAPYGVCTAPFQNVRVAHDVAPNGSVLLFEAGVYHQAGPVRLTKPLTLFSQPTVTQSTTVIQPPGG